VVVVVMVVVVVVVVAVIMMMTASTIAMPLCAQNAQHLSPHIIPSRSHLAVPCTRIETRWLRGPRTALSSCGGRDRQQALRGRILFQSPRKRCRNSPVFYENL
jgi:hypothetical protein